MLVFFPGGVERVWYWESRCGDRTFNLWKKERKKKKRAVRKFESTAIAFHCQPVSPVFSSHLFFDLFFPVFLLLLLLETYSTFSTRHSYFICNIKFSFFSWGIFSLSILSSRLNLKTNFKSGIHAFRLKVYFCGAR